MKMIGKIMRQIFRFGLVGLSLNFTLYIAYLILTAFYLSPFNAVFLLYPVGVVVGFFAHRRFTFKVYSQKWRIFDLSNYVFLSVTGFFLNFLLLYVFFEKLGYPHQLV